MRILPTIGFVLIVTLALGMSLSQAAEVRLAVVGRISLPSDCPFYSEELTNFYGNTIDIPSSPGLRARAENQLGHKVPDSLVVTVVQVPNTSLLSITATGVSFTSPGVDEPAATAFLSALTSQFFKYEADRKKKAYADAIAQVETAISSAPKELVPQLTAYKDHLVMASLLDTKGYWEISEF